IVEAAFLIAPLYFANRALRQSPQNRALQGDRKLDFQGDRKGTPLPSTASPWKLALRALGFRSPQTRRTALWIMALLLAILAVDILYQYVITVLHLNLQTNDQVILEQSKTAPLSTYAILIAAVLIAPPCEEIFFR